MSREDVAFQIEAAGFGGQGGEPMIPAFAVEFRAKGIDPDWPRWIAARMMAEFVCGAQPKASFELGVAGLAAFLEDVVESELEAALIGVVAGAPVADPDRPWIGSIPYGKTIQPCSKTSVERAFGSFVGAILGRMASVPRGELRATSMPLRPRRSGSPDWGVETRCLEVRRLGDDNT
jgi:hypothetical protein